MRLHLRYVLILALFFSGISAPYSVADDLSGSTSETDNYANMNGSTTAKQGFYINNSTFLNSNRESFTVEMWIKPGETSTTTEGILFLKQDAALYEISNGEVFYRFNSGGTWATTTSTTYMVRVNEWQHLSFVKGASTLSLYVNGQLVYTNTNATLIPTIGTRTSFFALGASSWDGSTNQAIPSGFYYSGGMDEVKVWSSARTQSQIQTGMSTKIADNTAGLLGYWDFNGSATSTIYDRSGNGVNLTVGGTPAPTFPDTKLTNTTGSTTILSFTRTYLNGFGGWKVPTGVSKVDLLAVGGGGGGGNNVGGGGSGGGGYYATNIAVNPGDSLPIKVGYGGAGGRYTAAGSLTFNGTNLINGQSGDSSTITIGANTYLGGGGGGGHTYWGNNSCAGSGATTVWSVAGVGSGSGGTASTGGLGGATNSSQATANGKDGFTNSITGTSIYYGSGGGSGSGYASAATGVGANSKGGNGSSSGAGSNGAALSGAGGGGGYTNCNDGGYGASGIVFLSMFAFTATPSNVSTAVFQTQTSLVANVNFAGKVTFYAKGKRIGGCINVATTGSGPYTATCNWMPAFRGAVAVTAIYTPTASPSNAVTLSWGSVFVSKRSGNR